MPHLHLPTAPTQPDAVPEIVDRSSWERTREALLAREKAHTREGDAIAAARRRLPMTRIPDDATVEGPAGTTPFLDIFDGRRMLVAYFHMWHDGEPWENQCEGCTFIAAHLSRQEYLNERDVTVAVLTEGTFAESKPYADWLGYSFPWYSARGSEGLLVDRGFGWFGCYLLHDGHAYETYWSTDRGTEAVDVSYQLLDMTVFGRQERWEDSPEGWPRIPEGQHQWRSLGRPTVQWGVTDEQV